MVLLNKSVLSSFDFSCPTALLLFQCTCCGLAAWVCGLPTGAAACRDSVQLPTEGASSGSSPGSRQRWREIEPLTWPIARTWIPVNALFVAMVWTSLVSLAGLGVPMVTVLKNLTNLFTIGGDYLFHGRTYGLPVWASLTLIIISALCGAATDMTFTVSGYAWQLSNCVVTAAYSLSLRAAMDTVVKHTQDNKVSTRKGEGCVWACRRGR